MAPTSLDSTIKVRQFDSCLTINRSLRNLELSQAAKTMPTEK